VLDALLRLEIRFNIGVFPFAMIASLVLFLSPDLPQRIWELLMNPPSIPVSTNPAEKASDDPSDDENKVTLFDYSFRYHLCDIV